MIKYYDTEQENIITIEELKKNYIDFLQESTEFDDVSFCDYIDNCMGKNGNLTTTYNACKLNTEHDCESFSEYVLEFISEYRKKYGIDNLTGFLNDCKKIDSIVCDLFEEIRKNTLSQL